MNRETRSIWTLTLLTVFLTLWLYTEFSEYFERDLFQQNVEKFMQKGGRFTEERGAELENRVSELERYNDNEPADQ